MIKASLLRQDLPDHFTVYVRQSAVEAVVQERQLGVIDAEQMEYGVVIIVVGGLSMAALVPNLSLSPGVAGLHPRAGEPDREAVAVVIAPGAAVQDTGDVVTTVTFHKPRRLLVLSPRNGTRTSIRSSIDSHRLLSGVPAG